MSNCEDNGQAGSPASGSGQCGPDQTDLGCQKGSDPCEEYPLTATPWCDDRLLELGKRKQVSLIGSDGCQLYKLDGDKAGMVLFDGKAFYVSSAPCDGTLCTEGMMG